MTATGSSKALVLVLNASYEFLNVTTLRQAVKLLYKRKAEIVEEVADRALTSVGCRHTFPSVIRMVYYIRRSFREVPLTRRNIIERDGHTCQYCSRPGTTVDHVVPRSRGGENSWTNCVCACLACNHKKNNQTLKESGMTLLSRPRKPAMFPWLSRYRERARRDWGRYLYCDGP